jgi:hypothetical protein
VHECHFYVDAEHGEFVSRASLSGQAHINSSAPAMHASPLLGARAARCTRHFVRQRFAVAALTIWFLPSFFAL